MPTEYIIVKIIAYSLSVINSNKNSEYSKHCNVTKLITKIL